MTTSRSEHTAPNLARQFMEFMNVRLEDFEGYCLELVDEVMHFIDRDNEAVVLHIEPHYRHGGVLYPQVPNTKPWRYHAVLFIDDLVHDGWLEEALPVRDYLRRMFPNNEELDLTYFTGEDERVERWTRGDFP